MCGNRRPARARSRQISFRTVLKAFACIALSGYIVNLLRLMAVEVK